MKASLKFREDQKPLLKAKVPLNILGIPFQSGVVSGHSKELTLNLATFFQSGPSIKFSYRPNDSGNPFSLILKTGTGSFGSPVSGSVVMSCEFNLQNRSGNGNVSPVFMLHFKPRFGDFSFKKSRSSIFEGKEGCDSMVMGSFSPENVNIFRTDSQAAGAIANFFSGAEVTARTSFPVMKRAVVNCRWGVRVPVEIKSGGGASKTTPGIAFQKSPFLVMDKIGVELMSGGDSKKVAAGVDSPVNDDVAEVYLTVKKHLEVLRGENGMLRNAVEDLRREIGHGDLELGKYRDFERNGGKNYDGKKNGKKLIEANKSEELKKA
ncbi:hypothetical protein TanjilG_25632 [Lupinus angustifolius]|uniref:Uncharacterized protein n=1 Tax=Lupinus angustifolius TaxID=3871 RepID=A0A4P1QTD9_LUPAN|nr:PREDICTED: uncharacterized protein LOC109330812 [Lupinus angustifolius]OIV94570.1 hypothetical protein TanjilG_25632 [Lupinus angustifolius]